MRLALELSKMALQHFHDHGDVAYIQKFHDAMPENYARRTAFKLWLRDNAPITMEGKKFLKDKDEDAIEFNLERAFGKPFWEYAPEKETIVWKADTFITQLERDIKRYGSSDKMEAADEHAVAILNKTKSFVKGLRDAEKNIVAA
jgi:hypothetical protein